MNVIWIVSDTVRRKDLGTYGNKKIRTPSIDALAAKSVRFDRHYAASFPTMPARADFMTGRWTFSFMQWAPIPSGEVLLAEKLRNAGIYTAGVVDTPFYIRDAMNYDQGFVWFHEVPGQYDIRTAGIGNWAGRRLRRNRPEHPLESDCFAPQTFHNAMDWLELNYKENFFLYIDTWDPHEPWNAPVYYTERYWPGYDGELQGFLYKYWKDVPGYTEDKLEKAHLTYCGELSMVDTWIGNLLRQVEYMGLMENTAIIFTTDHGYYFGEHGILGKMVFAPDPRGGQAPPAWDRSPLYEEVTGIPLLIYVPGMKPGTYRGLTSAVDLMPTVLELFGQKIPDRVEGRSLLPVMKDETSPGRDMVFTALPLLNAGDVDQVVDAMPRMSTVTSMSTVTTDDWAFLYDVSQGGSELYDLRSDRDQKNNVISGHEDVARELHKAFVKFMRDTNVPERLLETRKELRL